MDPTENAGQCQPIVKAGAGTAQLPDSRQKRMDELLKQILSQPVHRDAQAVAERQFSGN